MCCTGRNTIESGGAASSEKSSVPFFPEAEGILKIKKGQVANG